MQLIAQVSRYVVGQKPLLEMVQDLTDEVRKAMGADACVLRQLQGEDLVLLAKSGIRDGLLPERHRANSGIAGELIGQRHPVAVSDASTHPATAELHARAVHSGWEFIFYSYAGTPLIANGNVVGALGVYATTPGKPFTEVDLEDLQIVGNHIAVAMENDRLYRELQKSNESLREEVRLRQSVEERLVHHAFHDGLTGIANRALFSEHLQRSVDLAHSKKTSFCLVLFDIDRFKVINESEGHTAGDQLLIGLSEALRRGLEPQNVVARLGGDMFVIMLEDTSHDMQRLVARLHQMINGPYKVNKRDIFLSATMGIVNFSPRYQDASEMLRDAETAMYTAREEGKHYLLFDPEMHARARLRFDIESELHHALARRQIRLAFQPIIRTRTGRVAGFEALARWEHPVHGEVETADFISVAEHSDLVLELDEHVLHESCLQAARWESHRKGDPPPFVSVNVSGRRIARGDLPDVVTRVIKETGIPPGRLHLELTETILMQRPHDTIEQLEAVRESGARVCIDDFGTGYSSLSYLDCLPLDVLKIDRSFIAPIKEGAPTSDTVPAIIRLGQSLGLSIVAEGVETSHQYELMKNLHADFVQGYFLAHPMLLRDLSSLENAG